MRTFVMLITLCFTAPLAAQQVVCKPGDHRFTEGPFIVHVEADNAARTKERCMLTGAVTIFFPESWTGRLLIQEHVFPVDFTLRGYTVLVRNEGDGYDAHRLMLSKRTWHIVAADNVVRWLPLTRNKER